MYSAKKSILEDECRDAVNLLYSNAFSGLFVSCAAGTVLVFAFETPEVQESKLYWWGVFTIVLALRLVDTLYWKHRLSAKPFDSQVPFLRLASGSMITAILWSGYVFIVALHAQIIELAFTLIIISAMAGGSATVLAGSKMVAIGFSSVLLIPSSLFLISTAESYLVQLGGLGIVFGFVMVFSAKKAASFTTNAIHIKHQNRLLVDEMEIEKQEVTRVNQELSLAYDEINNAKNSLETEVIKRTEQIHRLSNLDPLTKLYNRNAFIQAMSSLLKKSKQEGFVIAVLFVDLDGFKQINDALGHQIGDKVLRIVTRRILDLRANGNIGRWGGDEFVLALPDCNETLAISHAESVIASIASTIKVGSLKLNIGASIGISLSPQHSCTEHELIQFADIAMYEQKNSGEKSPRVFSSELLVELQEKERLREGLREALTNNELFVVYQPIIDTGNREVTSCEALLRWSFGNKTIPPSLFIEIAEQSGLIIEIGRWVLKQACMDAVSWSVEKPYKVSVNVSMVQLLDDAFIEYLDEALQDSQLPANQLIIEITESTFVEKQDRIRHLLEEIKSRNVGISIDDFGTGYSSMSQLQILPFDTIKIDRSFVSNICGKGEAIIKATLFIAKELNCKTVAEGVENSQQADALKSMGADYLQGFMFAKPMDLTTLLSFLDVSEETKATRT